MSAGVREAGDKKGTKSTADWSSPELMVAVIFASLVTVDAAKWQARRPHRRIRSLGSATVFAPVDDARQASTQR